MSVSEELDRLERHPHVVRLRRSLAEHPSLVVRPEPNMRLAAILLALRARADGEPELLMIKRAEAEGDPWSGHIACPGGRMEDGDNDLAVTAVRETLEETGVDVARDGRLLGHLDDISPRTPVLPPIVVRPYVAIVTPEVRLELSDEVAAAFWAPLDRLRHPDAAFEATVVVRGEEQRVPALRHADYTIWGMTERIFRDFLRRLADA